MGESVLYMCVCVCCVVMSCMYFLEREVHDRCDVRVMYNTEAYQL